MKPIRSLNILGDTIEILVDGSMTGGSSTTLVHITPPGGGPPLHTNMLEDQSFTVLEGEFEFFSDGEWRAFPMGEIFFVPRGKVNTFRNAGKTMGRMAVFLAPAGLEGFFEKIAGLSPAKDLKCILEVFDEYGIVLHTA